MAIMICQPSGATPSTNTLNAFTALFDVLTKARKRSEMQQLRVLQILKGEPSMERQGRGAPVGAL